MGFIDKTYIRLYAHNLQRGWRNTRQPASADAMFTVSILIMLSLALLFAAVRQILIMESMDFAAKLSPTVFKGAVFVGALLFYFLFNSRLSKIEVTKELLDCYAAPSEQRKIFYFICIVVFSWLINATVFLCSVN